MNIKARPLTIDGLMRYLRSKNIKINGSSQKRKLRNIGYYHGYKGYRFINKPTNKINISDINEVFAYNDFDVKLKTLLYPKIMFIETALKNYTLEVILQENNSSNFYTIFNNSLTEYTEHRKKSYKEMVKQRLSLRNCIYKEISDNYSNKEVICHFYDKGINTPIWAIFEIITLGEFGYFVKCLNYICRDKLSNNLGIQINANTDRRIPEKIIFVLTGIRNAVAHNEVVYDTRFKKSSVPEGFLNWFESETNIHRIDMNHIEDYFILIACLLMHFKVAKSEVKKFLNDFKSTCELLRKQISINYYSQIITTDLNNKLVSLNKYIKNL